MSDRSPRLDRFSPLVQIVGLVRKELIELLRQPRVLLVLVLGPFAVLGLFASGFDRQQTVLVTQFVGPADGPYESALDDFGDGLGQYIDINGYSSDIVAARQQLVAGDVDLIVVLPSDPVESIVAGEQATIEVIHDKIDPIQQTTVDVSTEVAVQELNSRILEAAIGRTRALTDDEADVAFEILAGVDGLASALEQGDDDAIAAALTDLDEQTRIVSAATTSASDLASALDADTQTQQRFDGATASSTDLASELQLLLRAPEAITEDDAARLSELADSLDDSLRRLTSIPADVLVRPFSATAESLERRSVSTTDFFTTGAIALLLQHMVLTFAAMSLVTDRSSGLFEMFQIGPIGSGRILTSKYAVFVLVGGLVAVALFIGARFGIDVPLRGDVTWLALGVVLLLTASIGIGSVVSLLSSTATQAVQYALLVLLASLFFTGLFLDTDTFVYPVKALIWALPATYGTHLVRDVALRGDRPATADLVGLTVASVGYLTLAWLLLWRRLRTH